MRCEFIGPSAGSIVQDRVTCGGNARGKMQGDITKVTRCSRNGKNAESAVRRLETTPHIPKKGICGPPAGNTEDQQQRGFRGGTPMGSGDSVILRSPDAGGSFTPWRFRVVYPMSSHRTRREACAKPRPPEVLEVESDCGRDRPRRHVVRAAERRQEVVQRIVVRQVDDVNCALHL